MKNEKTFIRRKATPKMQDICKGRYFNEAERAETDPVKAWAMLAKRVGGSVMGDRENSSAVVHLIGDRLFLPNTPAMVNAGSKNGQLAACFVLGVDDSLPSIMDHAKRASIIHQTGGGTGMTYEFIRPMGSPIGSQGRGEASGPVSFMNIVNTMTDVVKQGGVRRGANMGMLRVTHPDCLRFIHAKNDQTTLTNFNISVNVTDVFMSAVQTRDFFQTAFGGADHIKPVFDPVTGGNYSLVFRNEDAKNQFEQSKADVFEVFADKAGFDAFAESNPGFVLLEAPAGQIYAPEVFRRICASAHKYGEPGLGFIDEINRHNHMAASMGPIFASNPCGEQFLHFNNSCNLGSIDVAKLFDVNADDIDEAELRRVVRLSVEFLDKVVDECAWPTPEITDVVHRTRPIGLGVMGVADMLMMKKLRYDSPEGRAYASRMLEIFQKEAWLASFALGKKYGVFPEFKANKKAYIKFFQGLFPDMDPAEFTPRNYEVSTIAPTGTISLIAGCSSGIEPNFAWVQGRVDTVSNRVMVHPLVAEFIGIELNFEDPEVYIEQVKEIQSRLGELPEYFVTAMQIDAKNHLLMMAAAQPFIDNSISKTCNAFADDTVESVEELFQSAYDLKCKAVTYYRDGSRNFQVLTDLSVKKAEEAVKAAEAVAGAAVPSADILSKIPVALNRPQMVRGFNWVISFGDAGKLYVTVNYNEDNKIVEVFASGPVAEPSTGLLASKMLQSGVFSVDDVASTLNKQTGTNSIFFNQRSVTSVSQAVAECMWAAERLLKGLPAQKQKFALPTAETGSTETSDESPKPDADNTEPVYGICPKCKEEATVPVGGCPSCLNCGYSKC